MNVSVGEACEYFRTKVPSNVGGFIRIGQFCFEKSVDFASIGSIHVGLFEELEFFRHSRIKLCNKFHDLFMSARFLCTELIARES